MPGSAETSGPSEPIKAAGGLLWRNGPRGREIAVIHRHRYADWTFPKGKLDAGESWRDGALREVREETGYAVSASGLAGTCAYEVKGRPKVVVYFHMALAGAARTPIDADEVASVEWLTVAEARERLTYPLEGVLLDVAVEEP